jgi:hypothetical protein
MTPRTRLWAEDSSSRHLHFAHAHSRTDALSRRQLMRHAAGVAGLVLGAELWTPAVVAAGRPGSAEPRPIPQTITVLGVPIHHMPPASGNDPSQITDFKGFAGNSRTFGTGRGTAGGVSMPFLFQADMGFMQGEFIGLDGDHHEGTFAFV